MPTSKDSDAPDDAPRRGSETTGRTGGASFAALYARQRRLSGLRLLKPGRRAVIPAVSFVLLAALIAGIATLTSHFSSSGSKTVAASRPTASVGATHRGPASSPTAAGRATVTHKGGKARPKQSAAGHEVPPSTPTVRPGGAGGGTATHPSTTGGAAGSPAKTSGSTVPTQSSSTPTSSGPFHITGQLLCESGHAVVGVWVQTANASDSRYAAWKGVGDGSTADWWTDLPTDESYTLNVGCGGTGASWATSNATGWYSGGHNSFNCDDVSGDPNYEKCAHR